QGERAVFSQRDARPERAIADLAAAAQVGALLAPGGALAREDPGGTFAAGGYVAADQERVAVRRQGKGPPEAFEGEAGGLELAAQLGPGRAGAGEGPDRALVSVVAGPAHDGEVAVGGERRRYTEH